MVWRQCDPLNFRLEKRFEASRGRRLLEKAASMPLSFFEASASYDKVSTPECGRSRRAGTAKMRWETSERSRLLPGAAG